MCIVRASSTMATGGGRHAHTQTAGVVYSLPGAHDCGDVLPGMWSPSVYGLPLPTLWQAWEVGRMAKYKRWERPIGVYERQRTVRHSRVRFWPVRGMACEECGERLPPTHPFAVYGGWCVSCWGWVQGGCEVVGDGGSVLASSWQVMGVRVDG